MRYYGDDAKYRGVEVTSGTLMLDRFHLLGSKLKQVLGKSDLPKDLIEQSDVECTNCLRRFPAIQVAMGGKCLKCGGTCQ